MTKTEITYHWRTLTTDGEGNVTHIDQTDDMPAAVAPDKRLVLACEITGNDGTYYILLAEVIDGALPAMFSDPNGQQTRAVPERFHAMVGA